MTKHQKVYAFIDSQNLYLGIKAQGWELDYSRFFTYLVDVFNVEKAYLFIGYISGNERLYIRFVEAGFIVVFKQTLTARVRSKTIVKGNVDTELVVNVMDKLSAFDSAIIVSGDGDFEYLVSYLRDRNKLCKVIIPDKRRYSALLRRHGRYLLYLNGLRAKLGRKKRGRH